MLIVPYNPSIHNEHMATLMGRQSVPTTSLSDLPMHGLIAFHHGEPVAIGFLRCIEGPYAMLDSYISNPSMEPHIRDQALNKITAKLIKIATYNNISKLLAFSADYNTVSRAVNHGFHTHPHVFTVKTLCQPQEL